MPGRQDYLSEALQWAATNPLPALAVAVIVLWAVSGKLKEFI